MAESSEGPHPIPDISSNLISSAGDMRFYLQNLLDSKEKQLQQAGTLGQRVLAQQMELEERIRQLHEFEVDKPDEDEVDSDVRGKYRELGDTIMAWDAENAQLSSAFGASLKRTSTGKSSSPSFHFTDLPHENPVAHVESDRATKASSAASTSAAAQSRRAKNAAHRADDVEFAFEIGSGLLTEVRRLQSLLAERDKAIQDIKEEKDDLEKTVESLRTALRQQEQSADKFKEENWNLEVSIQELRTQLTDTVTTNARLESEQKRLNKLLASSRDAADTHQNESERVGKQYEELKLKHENDMALARKNTAAHARERNDLQQTVDSLKADLTRATRRFGGRSPLTPNGTESGDAYFTPAHEGEQSDIFTGGASTRRRNKLDASGVFAIDDFGELLERDDPPESPLKGAFPANKEPANEIEALQKRLAHAQRQINTLKSTLTKEKQMRLELRNKLDTSPVKRSDDEEDNIADQDSRIANRRLTPFRVGGRGRGLSSGNRGMTLMQRLGMATSSPVASYADYGDEDIDDEHDLATHSRHGSIPPVPQIPVIHRQDEDDEVAAFFGSKSIIVEQAEEHEEPEQTQSNRTSVASIEGMDPQFANVLKRTSSNGSTYAASPLRQSVFGRSPRGRGGNMNVRRSRGGVPFKEGARPPSLVDAPDILATELSGVMDTMNGSPLKGIHIPEEDEFMELRKELMDFGCQTDEVQEEKAVIVSEPAPVVVEMGIQVEPEPVPEPPKVKLVEMSMQTEPEPTPPIIQRSDFGIQYTFVEPSPPKPILLDVAIGTEPVIEPKASLSLHDEYVRDRRTTLRPIDLSFTSSISSTSSSNTITRQFLAIPSASRFENDLDDGEETETGPGTETDDNYYDARQSIMMSSPSGQSRESFHSIMTVTDNEVSDNGSEDEDDDDSIESIKASQFGSTAHLPSIVSSSVERKTLADVAIMAQEKPKEYSTVSISADLYVEKEPEKIYIVPPKPDVKEISIQTDDWVPPPLTPITSSPQKSPATPVLYRVGSATSQQFQFIPPPPPSSTLPIPSIQKSSIPTPTAISSPSPIPTNLARTRSTPSDRRQSIESAISSINAVTNALNKDDARARVQSTGPTLTVVDRSKPPTMILPPPPRAPPPPITMLPPTFIPDRRFPTSPRDAAPPRPSSPPPPELIRAATPVGGMYGPKSNLALRSHGSSVPPSQILKQPPSTSSFRSAGHAVTHGPQQYSNGLSSHSVRERSNATSATSPRSSVSSERDLLSFEQHRVAKSSVAPSTPNKSADITPRAHDMQNAAGKQATDPTVIHSITQTMIGEFLYKYTRRAIGKGHGERRHRRFFWVHPYTKTLYWSSADPGSSNVSESSAKSAYIEGVRSVLDPNPMPPGLYQYSVIVSTPQREMKITCPTKERHDIWFNALKYLLSRPNPTNVLQNVQESPASYHDYITDDERTGLHTSPQSQRSTRSVHKGDTWSTTPRGQRSRSQLSVGGSVGKRSGTPALEYLRWNGPDSPYSPSKSFVDVAGDQDEEDLDFELHGDSLIDDGFEGLENVRACCDGRHTVGHSGQHHHHHHHHNHPLQSQLPQLPQHPPTMVDRRRSKDHQLLDPHQEVSRPSSPSAWSFRSRTGSTHSHEGGGGGLFSLRFGSRRSAKTSLSTRD
ncbi:coiled-coil protein [Amanita muscaria]